jgi:RNA polymerase sigma-70 factor (ECF subfamily)
VVLALRFDSPGVPRYVGTFVATRAGPGDEVDQALIARMADGDAEALGRLYDRWAPHLLALARRTLGHGDGRESEDLVHDVFLEIWRQAATYSAERGSVRAWMAVRVRSRALDRLKAPRIARTSALGEGRDLAFVPAEDPTLGADRAAVCRALAELPADQRTVLELGYFEGLSSSEIALRVAIPVGTVKSRVAAGLARLREALR